MDTTHPGWPTSSVGPGPIPEHVRALLADGGEVDAVAVSATGSTVNIWTSTVPSPAHVRAWEEQTGKVVSVTITTEQVMSGLLSQRRGEEHNTTYADLLVSTAAGTGEPVNETVGGSWPATTQIVVDENRPGRAKNRNTWLELPGGVWHRNRIEALVQSLGAGSGNATGMIAEGVRAHISATSTHVVLRIKPAHCPSVDDVRLPLGTPELTAAGPGVVIVGSAPGQGKTSLAYALATHAAGRADSAVALLSGKPTWQGSAGRIWTVWDPQLQGWEKTVDNVLAEGHQVVLIDDTPSVIGDEPAWRASQRLAAGGACVILTCASARMSSLPEIVLNGPIQHLLRGMVVRTLIPVGDGAVPVDDTLVVTDDLHVWLRRGGGNIDMARDLYGYKTGMSFDTALAKTVLSGQISPADAAPWVRDSVRYSASGGHTENEYNVGQDENATPWQWEQ